MPDYALVSVGPNASLFMNSGPINGKLLVGDGSLVTSSGFNNGQVTGGLDVSGVVKAGSDLLQNLQIPPAINTVPASVGTQAFADAAALSAAAAALPATQTFGNISGTQNFVGNGGLNVIDVTSLQYFSNLSITGSADDVFVFNISSAAFFNTPLVLNGVDASHILWNFTGGLPGLKTVFSTSPGNQLFGTFLTTQAADYSLLGLRLRGQVINTGGNILFGVPASQILETVPFAPEPIPEPNTLSLLATGVFVAAAKLHRKVSFLSKFRS